MANKNHIQKDKEDAEQILSRKDLKKIHKLEAQIPYHEGRGNMDEVAKIKGQVDAIWAKAVAAKQ